MAGKFSITLDRKTGLATGTFLHPVFNRNIKLSGVFLNLPDGQLINGFFIDATSYGSFWLTP